jgi:signal transduction histidine kinase/DNA-binding response OmpR family regulator
MPLLDVSSARILVVDDESANVDLLVACLADEGYTNVFTTRRSAEVVDLYLAHLPDLILLDLHMPGMDGFSVMQQLREVVPGEQYLPILVLTADVTPETKLRALSSGGKDFLTKPLDITEVVLRIRNLLESRFLHEQQRVARARAEAASRRALLLSDASHLLASSFDYHTTLSVLCRSLVPSLADFCMVDVLEGDGRIARAGVAHADPERETMLRAAPVTAAGMKPEHPVVAALTTGKVTLAETVTPEMIGAIVGDDDQRALHEALAPQSVIVVPLIASGQIHGALVLVAAESGRRFDTDDLELARELARRAAHTVENARLFIEAQEATQARDQMLAVVAHDLRNPLSTVSMGAEMLQEESTDESHRKMAEMVGRAANRMQRLIEDLLEASRIQRGRLHMEVRPERVQPVLAEAISMLGPLAAGAGIRLEEEIGSDVPPVLMDGTRILQVISNLLGNALKFTPAGGTVRVGCTRCAAGVRIQVSDTGKGIPAEQIPHIFGQYWQANDSDARGIGLGLSIVRGIVRAHGGEIWVESEPGRGTTFFFTLPVADPSPQPADDSADPAVQSTSDPLPMSPSAAPSPLATPVK